ncbi:hypothetical protein BFJ63_vAg14660 [Fusarium oxysporum f. sp. narcissi]|uniref:Alpha-N-arabinofuranosidase 2 n=2 Tax=Fusarium oxysporum TaxID=5507 RepID=A0A4Q2V6Q7_FUSOX|nr:arabinofuranosidase [Fusarium oxysporum Fo47]KAJ4111403.1 hypothetical protein NW765_016528 [Fusarium oxysporum]RYC82442.1 hypothetical protein BFJ63_vAg14660 [Fusarium oxysporum f. sp. narcissi]EWZ28943.1 hypothetical protein FOZG_17381 [Fusarium oxysporum Fo47]KAJ4273460.1 hypothetical protein NW764_012005 [Fusarium oxysporum]QKD61220.1 arabinofuranosidase [Fusarium oxysporum Fo47]
MKISNFISASLVALLSSVSYVQAATYSNPLEPRNGGDPSIVWHAGWYYMTSTTWGDVRLRRAKTLNGLKTGESKIIYQSNEPSRCCNVWAPELHNVGGTWHVYFSAGTRANTDNQRSQVLKGGANPWDEFRFAGTLNTPNWAIDGTRLTIDNKNYFVYSCWRSDTGTNLQSLCISLMSSPTTLTGGEFLLSSPTADWERFGDFPVNEGPFALYHGGKTFISFSASFCGSPQYSLGYLTYRGSGDPRQKSNWKKSGRQFTAANGNFGTGHNSFFTSPDGTETWMAYHSTPNAAGSCGDRFANAKKIDWNPDGSPKLGSAPAANQNLAGPRGE